MSLDTLTHKVHLAKIREWKTDKIYGQLTKDEKCLSIILYGTAALWSIYHGFICLIKNFIRAERLHDFELHRAVAYLCSSRSRSVLQSSTAYLEQITELEIQYGALVKTFKIVGLHTVRYN